MLLLRLVKHRQGHVFARGWDSSQFKRGNKNGKSKSLSPKIILQETINILNTEEIS